MFERWIKTGQWRRTGASVPTIVGGDPPRFQSHGLLDLESPVSEAHQSGSGLPAS